MVKRYPKFPDKPAQWVTALFIKSFKQPADVFIIKISLLNLPDQQIPSLA